MMKKIFIGLAVAFIGLQFVPAELNQSEVVTENDFIKSENPPLEIANLLKNSCYDCHSNNTAYPWFDKIKPVTFWVNHHVEEGKEHLNFSEWGTYSEQQKAHKLEEIIEEVEEKEMPLNVYLLTHGEAEVSKEQFVQLENWVNTLK